MIESRYTEGEVVYRFAWQHVSVLVHGIRSDLARKLAKYLAVSVQAQGKGLNADITILSASAQPCFYVTYHNKQYKVTANIDLLLLLSTLIPACFLDKYRELQRIHAAGILIGDKVLLISGDGGVGKSTIGLSAWLNGYRILGDDWLLMDISRRGVKPVPKPMKPRMDSAQFEELMSRLNHSECDFGTLYGETRALIGRQQNFVNDWATPFSVGAMVFLESYSTASQRMEKVEVRALIPLFLSQTMLCQNSKNLVGIQFAKLLADQKTPVFKFRKGFSSPGDSLNQILEAVKPWFH